MADPSDPSALTTDQVRREVAGLKELLIERISATEKAVEVAHDNLTRVPTDVDKAIRHVKEVMAERFTTMLEKFDSVQTQFKERDVRTEQTQKDSRVAVDAALQAAKEAVGKQQENSDKANTKTELGFTKQIDNITALIDTKNKALDDKVDDLKKRLGAIEGQALGSKDASTKHDASVSQTVAIIGAVIALVIGVFGSGFLNHAPAKEIVYVPAPTVPVPVVK